LNAYEPLYYASLADAYYRIGLVDFAVDELKKSVRMEPQYFPYFLLGTIANEQGSYDEAIGYFKKALALNGEDYQVREKLGLSYMRKEMYGEAIDVFKTVLENRPKSSSALFFTAVCYEKLKDNEKALIYYKKCLESDPENPEMKKEATEKVEAFRH
jgi:tetratricopeptide (TPR) repeat protein